MKIASLITALVATAALTAFGQDGVIQEVKHGAKKAGETIKDGLETAGEKTKETAKTVGKKTKEAAETVGEKTKETGETNRRWHRRKSIGDYSENAPQVQAEHQQSKGPNHGRTDDRRRLKVRRHQARRPDSESAAIVATTPLLSILSC